VNTDLRQGMKLNRRGEFAIWLGGRRTTPGPIHPSIMCVQECLNACVREFCQGQISTSLAFLCKL
jgi:hypothetical protein